MVTDNSGKLKNVYTLQFKLQLYLHVLQWGYLT